jgi:multimeric flavodoxin WrbA
MTKILVIHTSTHEPEVSSSALLTQRCVSRLAQYVDQPEVRFIDAAKLHIVENLGCYSNGKMHCADPQAGKYRCWANYLSQKDPKKYGGKDEMGLIYDNLNWADIVVFSTCNRWGSHTSVAQRVIERMNTIENRSSVYHEPYPLLGKKLGIVVTGLHWETGRIGHNLLTALRWFGFATQPDETNVLGWQRTKDVYFEHPENDRPFVLRWAESEQGHAMIDRWAQAVVTSTDVIV